MSIDGLEKILYKEESPEWDSKIEKIEKTHRISLIKLLQNNRQRDINYAYYLPGIEVWKKNQQVIMVEILKTPTGEDIRKITWGYKEENKTNYEEQLLTHKISWQKVRFERAA